MSAKEAFYEALLQQVLSDIKGRCDPEALERVGGSIVYYLRDEVVLRDCGQRGVCRTPPGCMRCWQQRNAELHAEVMRLEKANEEVT